MLGESTEATAPLSAKAESTLNRDKSRRISQLSAANATKGGWEKRQAALAQQLEALTKQAERAERRLVDSTTQTAMSEAAAEDEAEKLRKIQASASTMDQLLSQLEQRKAALYKERATVLAEDERLRSAASEKLKSRLAEIDQTQRGAILGAKV